MALKSLALSLLLVTAAPAFVNAASTSDSAPARVITWADLIPKVAVAPATPKSASSGAMPIHSNAAAALPEGKFMETKVPQAEASSPPAVVQDLNGKRVRIGGFIVPLDFNAMQVKEFLLVPYMGACVHVPAPPANQIVYVKAENGIDVSNTFDAVFVTGVIQTVTASTKLAESGYTLDAETVTAFKP